MGETVGDVYVTRVGFVIVALGIAAAFIAIFADALGIGGAPGFGWKQIALLGVAVVMIVVGVQRIRRPSRPEA